MKFRYIGEAPDGQIDMYGVTFVPGGVSEVTDEMAIRKLSGNAFFEVVDGVPEPDPEPIRRKPGRPPKVRTDDDADSSAIG